MNLITSVATVADGLFSRTALAYRRLSHGRKLGMAPISMIPPTVVHRARTSTALSRRTAIRPVRMNIGIQSKRGKNKERGVGQIPEPGR